MVLLRNGRHLSWQSCFGSSGRGVLEVETNLDGLIDKDQLVREAVGLEAIEDSQTA